MVHSPEPLIRPGQPAYWRLLIAMFCAGVATFAQLYSTQGMLPAIAEEVSVTEAQAALTLAAATLGVAVGVIPWSLVGDRLGSRLTLISALVISLAPALSAPFVHDFAILVGLRFVEGLALAGVPAVAIGYVLRIVAPPHRTKVAALYIAGTTIGGLSGRMLATLIAESWGWHSALLAVAAGSAVAVAAFVLLLPPAQAGRSYERPHLAKTLWTHVTDPRQAALFATAFLLMGAFVSIYNYVGFRVEAAPFQLSATAVSMLFLAYLAGTGASALVGPIVTRFGRPFVLFLASTGMLAGILLTIPDHLVTVIAGLVLMTAAFFAAHAIAASWVPDLAPYGAHQSSSLYNLAYYAGSSVVGWATGFVFALGGWLALAIVDAAIVLAALLWAGCVLRRRA